MTTQLLVVPSSTKNAVQEDGTLSRNLQLFFSNLVKNVNQNTVPVGGVILWPSVSPIPTGWLQVGTATTTIGGVVYITITHS